MKAFPIAAIDVATGTRVEAHQVGCPDCHGLVFELFVLAGHNHLRCVGCETSFCQAAEGCTAGLRRDHRTVMPRPAPDGGARGR